MQVLKLNDCIEFTGPKTNGYGRKWHENKRWLAHRLVWNQANGEIPDGLCVLHTCDNRACVNVDHLFLGTKADNNADRNAKGRQAKGSMQGSAKLHENDILRIRDMLRMGCRHVDIGRWFGVARATISAINTGRVWSHVT